MALESGVLSTQVLGPQHHSGEASIILMANFPDTLAERQPAPGRQGSLLISITWGPTWKCVLNC